MSDATDFILWTQTLSRLDDLEQKVADMTVNQEAVDADVALLAEAVGELQALPQIITDLNAELASVRDQLAAANAEASVDLGPLGDLAQQLADIVPNATAPVDETPADETPAEPAPETPADETPVVTDPGSPEPEVPAEETPAEPVDVTPAPEADPTVPAETGDASGTVADDGPTTTPDAPPAGVEDTGITEG